MTRSEPGSRGLVGRPRPGPPDAGRHVRPPAEPARPAAVAAAAGRASAPASASRLPPSRGAGRAVRALPAATILPYPTGNTHPGFMGWVQAAARQRAAGRDAGRRRSTPTSAAASTCRSRSSGRWSAGRAQLFGFPDEASGLWSAAPRWPTPDRPRCRPTRRSRGASRREGCGRPAARLVGLRLARGAQLRRQGVRAAWAWARQRCARCRSTPTSGCGSASWRRRSPPTARRARPVLRRRHGRHGQQRRDRRPRGARRPLPRRRSCGSTSTARSARSAILVPDAGAAARRDRAGRLAGLRLPQVGCTSPTTPAACWSATRPPTRHLRAAAAYLARAERGLAGGEPWLCDYGPELSRGFRALKVWFTL